jgi:hypothetical protein
LMEQAQLVQGERFVGDAYFQQSCTDSLTCNDATVL